MEAMTRDLYVSFIPDRVPEDHIRAGLAMDFPNAYTDLMETGHANGVQRWMFIVYEPVKQKV